MVDDRRKYPRGSVALSGTLLVDGDTVDCESLDLSLGGARVRAPRPVTIGADVVLALSAGDLTVVSKAEILSCATDVDGGEVEMRLRFTDLRGSRREALSRVLSHA